MFDTETVLSKYKTWLSVASWLTGGGAGFIQGMFGHDQYPAWICALVGIVAVLFAGLVGAVAGMFVRYFVSRHDKDREIVPERVDIVGGISLGTFVGAFLGIICLLSFGAWSYVIWGAAFGAGLGAGVGCVYASMADVLMRMHALDTRKTSSAPQDITDARVDKQDKAAEPWKMQRKK